MDWFNDIGVCIVAGPFYWFNITGGSIVVWLLVFPMFLYVMKLISKSCDGFALLHDDAVQVMDYLHNIAYQIGELF